MADHSDCSGSSSNHVTSPASDHHSEKHEDGEHAGGTKSDCGSVSLKNLTGLRQAMEALVAQNSAHTTLSRTEQEARRKTYAFWDTQPVPKFDEFVAESGPLEDDKDPADIRSEPYSLPAGFRWDTIDVHDDKQLDELYTLLTNNYVEDDESLFRFDYSPGFLRWALCPPDWVQHWHCGVRVEKTAKLVGFISAIPASISINNERKRMVEVNFLCVHKKLRSKRVAPVLIREVTRRVNRHGIFQAVYTAGVVLPRPIATCRYWHRSLNCRKLIDVKFSQLSRNMTMSRTLKLYRLPQTTSTTGWRQMTASDVPSVLGIVNKHLSKFKLAPHFSEREFRHWFVPQDDIVNSFVVENDNVITDFASYYSLPSTVMRHATHKVLRAAYSFYCVAGATPIVQLMKDVLITAHKEGFDVFNALDLMDNKSFLTELKFGMGDGNLQYYLYNYRCPSITPEQVGLILQ